MTRHIRLPLGSTTTETHCGDCPALGVDSSGPMASGYPLCRRYSDVLDFSRAALRLNKCRAAEVKDEDRGAIIRLLAMLVRAPTDDDGRPEIECSRETLVAMAMAARRELDAMRDKIKYEEV